MLGGVRRWLAAGTAAVALVAQTGGVSLAAGGTGGSPFTLNCPDGKALVGIQGRAGSYIDSIRGVCRGFDELGNADAPVTTGTTGGTGGSSSFDLRCPSGEAMVGVKGRADWWVDRVQIECAVVNTNGHGAGPITTDPFTAGGTGGNAFHTECPSPTNDPGTHNVMIGLGGRAEQWLDALTIRCVSALDIGQLSPIDPNRPDLRVSVVGLPFRVHAGDRVRYTATMTNVGKRIGAGAELDLGTNMPVNLPTIEVPFLVFGGCDVHHAPPPPGFVRCTAGAVDGTWATERLPVNVTVVAGTTGTFDFSATADPRNQIAEGVGGGDNNTRHETLRVVP